MLGQQRVLDSVRVVLPLLLPDVTRPCVATGRQLCVRLTCSVSIITLLPAAKRILPRGAKLCLPSVWHLVDCISTIQLNGKCGLQVAQITLQEVRAEGQTHISSQTAS